ncbi:HECT-domain (ubiquitin-transferase) [Ceratobasidium sp. AG-Ba]|nr:HECT-domain (ubiquitin-transferase) [Ceratobasidium sp. AG-Ba]
MTNEKPRTRSQHDTQPDSESIDEPGPRTRARAAATASAVQTAPPPAAPAPSTSTPTRRKDKGKHKQTDADTRPAKRPRRSAPAATTTTSLAINEPKRDPKGKKRAAPDPDSDDAATSSKKHKSPYSLRTRASLPNISKTSTIMPRKNKTTTRKSSLSKSQSRADDDMIDFGTDTRPEGDANLAEGSRKDKAPERHESDEEDDEEDSDDEDEDQEQEPPSSGLPPSGLDESAVSALFGADFRALGSYMLSLSSRLKTILNNIKPAANPTTRLMALQELSEILSMSTEDTLAGYFQVDSFVAELVRIMGGKGSGDDDDEANEDDEDASLAAALALSAGGFPGDENLEAQVLACRCLANLMEALPGCAHTVVYHGAVPVLCSKLIDIQYIDLAEQTLSTLEKISQDDSGAIVREGGLAALLNFLDFFSTNVQRTALQAAANCCRNISVDNYAMVKDVFPIIRTVLGYADPRLVEHASLCVIRTIESFRGHPELLEGLVDTALLRALASASVSPGTFTLILRALSSATKASPKITVALLEADVAGTLYQILTGVLPPTDGGVGCAGGENVVTGAAGAGGLTDMAVMQNLAHRPKDQVDEALSLVSELMPPLPRDGVFDHRAYSEKALARMVKAKIKALKSARNKSPGASAGPSNSADTSMSIDTGAEDPNVATPIAGPGSATPVARPSSPAINTGTTSHPGSPLRPGSPVAAVAPTLSRTDLLRSRPDLVGRYLRLMVPVLVDVYAASVSTQTRSKSLAGILKAVSFAEGEELNSVLKSVPVATFVGSILSSRDYPALTICALQLVELLLTKDPTIYRPALRREGVLHEIEVLTERPLASKVKDAKPEEGPSRGKVEEVRAKQEEGTQARNKVEDTSKTGTSSSPAPEATPERDESPQADREREEREKEKERSVIPIPVKRSSSAVLDPQDAITLRAKVVRFKHMSSGEDSAADPVLERLRGLLGTLRDSSAGEAELKDAVKGIASLFTGGTGASVSSYELLKSGLVDGLLQFTTDPSLSLDITARQLMVLQAFAVRSGKGSDSPSSMSPFAVLVKKLQDSLTRIENFEVVTVSPGAEASRRNSASMLARQLRLRIVAEEGTDAPRSCTNIVVSIHAIATFQALNDYLRPRVAGASAGMGLGGSRLSGVLAAFAAAAGLPAGALGRVASGASASASASGPGASSGATGGSSAPTIGRRRSQRLKAKDNTTSADGEESTSPTTEVPATSSSTPATSGAPPAPPATSTPDLGLPPPSAMLAALAAGGDPGIPMMSSEDYDMEHAEDMLNEDFEAEFYEEDMEPQHATPDKTVSVALTDDGTKVEAQTPDGTRVATPNPVQALERQPAGTPSSSGSKFSYATALKSKPTDWHLEFSMDDRVLPLDMTIYGAVHHHESRRAAASGSTSGPSAGIAALGAPSLWQGVYTVKYKKVPGPPPAQSGSRVESVPTSESALSSDSAHIQILRLLRVLHKMNLMAKDRVSVDSSGVVLPESAFVNNKLTAKLTRQLEEPMIVASQCLPDWAMELPQQYYFLFPFSTRFSFLQSTSFGYARLITKWQSQQQRSSDSSRRDDAFGYLGRLQRQKVRISRHHILESAAKVLELYGSSSSVLEVEYFEEVGTGLGPTLEFYSLVSKEFARRDLKMWRDADASVEGPYVQRPLGLFPAPEAKEGAKSRTRLFTMLGQFVGKALLDSRIIDISFNPLFLKYILNEEVPLTLGSLKMVDPALANSLSKLQAYGVARREIQASPSMSQAEKNAAYADLTIHGAHLEDLALDFTVPGYDMELIPGGKDVAVNDDNVEEYVREVIDVVIGRGIQTQAQAFRTGFSKVFPVTDLQSFSSDELDLLFGNAEEDWSTDTLTEALKADHGFNIDSLAIRDLISIMSSYDDSARRAFLQFITGSPKLPIGGFRGLSPQLTVVRKPHEAPLKADDYLPSVMTCVNYLKLPEYSAKGVMEARLKTAMMEGVGSFHLS